MKFFLVFLGMVIANLIALALFTFMVREEDDNEISYAQQEIFTSDELRDQYQTFHEKKVR